MNFHLPDPIKARTGLTLDHLSLKDELITDGKETAGLSRRGSIADTMRSSMCSYSENACFRTKTSKYQYTAMLFKII